MERVETNAHEAWKIQFRVCVNRYFAPIRQPFTAADVLEAMEQYYPHLKTHDNRAAGPLMQGLERAGVLRPTGRYVKSNRKASHCRPMREWIGVRKI
jgi:hypothetical protein